MIFIKEEDLKSEVLRIIDDVESTLRTTDNVNEAIDLLITIDTDIAVTPKNIIEEDWENLCKRMLEIRLPISPQDEASLRKIIEKYG